MTHFFSCDWGTSSFRLRRVDAADGRVVAAQHDDTGVKTLLARGRAGERERVFADFMRERLHALFGANFSKHDEVRVAISGMASSSVGWRELPYATLPVGLDGSRIHQEIFPLSLEGGATAQIHLISGVRSANEIMRGEETEILGLFAGGRHAELAKKGWVVLPGTHSKHVRLRHGQLTEFHTYMTGELFEVLAKQSLLAASVAVNETAPTLTDAAARTAFTEGVRAAAGDGLAQSLFQTRVRTVLQSVTPAVNRWFLSGLLIGAEVVDLTTREPSLPILLAAPNALRPAYDLAFQTLGLANRTTVVPPDEMALASVRGQLMLLRAYLKPDGSPHP